MARRDTGPAGTRVLIVRSLPERGHPHHQLARNPLTED
ncbi:hypothetical protein L842_0493 [Mycobacterium intracellulare MIN_052511_1280]|nr:hypothetical protein L842_0493 [Mycobacterium intracellulare MIN_052511_1280]